MKPLARSYRDANPLWIERFFGRSHWLSKAICFAAIPYAIGLVLATFYGFSYQYIVTDAFLIGTFGIALTTWTMLHGNDAQYDIYDDFLSAFAIDERQHTQIIRNTIGSYTRNIRQFLGMGLMFVVIVSFNTVGIFYWDGVGQPATSAGIDLFRYDTLARNGWYDEHTRVITWFILFIFSVFVCIVLPSAFYLIRRMPRMLIRCRNLPVLLPPRYLKYAFSSTADFYTRISVLWLLGVMTCPAFFRGNEGWATNVIVLVLASFGVINYLLPQIVYIHVAASSQKQVLLSFLGEDTLLARTHAHLDQASPIASMGMPRSTEDSIMPLLIDYDRSVYPWYQVYLFGTAYFLFVYWPTIADLYSYLK